jgi:NAD(P)-dependent dehydrogenase (short-subunit alcohol dehydrogenase family)
MTGFKGERVVFFHAAGTLTPIGYAGEVDPAAYRRNVLVNSAAPQVLGDAFLRAAQKTQARCDLVFISSGAAQSIYEGWSSYAAGKAAVDQWTRTAGAEQARRGGRCRVLAVAPGVVATPMQVEIRRSSARDFPEVARFVELEQVGALRDPDAAAREIWSLLSQDLQNGAVLDLRRPEGASATS